MFENKLAALDFYSPDNFEYLDDKVFRNFVSWLENQKIRLYTVEDRQALDQVDDPNWSSVAYAKYLNDLDLRNLTIDSEREVQIEKLLAHAVSLEFSDNPDFYNSKTKELIDDLESTTKEDPLEKIDYTSVEFREGLERLRKLLDIPAKENDPTCVLQAVSSLIEETFCAQADTKTKESNAIQLALDDIDLGFDTNDKALNDAAKILRLLYIKDLRDLQTQINESIVSVQNITANPKTDSSLGKVGR